MVGAAGNKEIDADCCMVLDIVDQIAEKLRLILAQQTERLVPGERALAISPVEEAAVANKEGRKLRARAPPEFVKSFVE